MTKLGDKIRNSIPLRNCGSRPWHETIPDETRKELEKVKHDWQNGKLIATKWTLARTISKTLSEEGVSHIGSSGVVRWLEQL